ncbi:2-amino-4-hydroxy-6-hydroxymethyldihydropteridine diphosphokinase, partial [Sphingorhabdus sp. EL138]|uniref:2-amino-4-hydroxy-6- hydroxymethyldihydropteridine diphosphokinase n=1 Tax=Sphingorhabdus sp. EL138 TaxID=2073156 RepID=UPI00341ADB23
TAGQRYTPALPRIFDLSHLYLIGIGSNQPHPVIGTPNNIIPHAIAALEMGDIDVFAHSATIQSSPMGPSSRRFANAAAVIATQLPPPTLLARLHEIESHFGRVRRGQNWGARVLDLDILLWSGGMWADSNPALSIPHPGLRSRGFVLTPAAMVAPDWRDPMTGLTIRHLQSRFNRPKALDQSPHRH